MVNILEKILEYRLKRKWTEYQLAENAELPQSTISSWYRKDQIPTIQSLEKICHAFNITLTQFFTEDNSTPVSLTENQRVLIDNFNRLNSAQQNAVLNLLSTL